MTERSTVADFKTRLVESDSIGCPVSEETDPSSGLAKTTVQPCRFGLDDLINFGLIADAGGIAAASRRHGIPKTSLSRSVARLESAAGVALFDRVGRGLMLTGFGERLVARAEEAANVSRETERTLLAELGKPHGPLRIGSTVHAALMLSAPVVARLARRWPGVRSSLKLVTDVTSRYVDDFDVLLSIGRPPDANLVSRRFLSLERGLYTSSLVGSRIDAECAETVAALPRVVIDGVDAKHEWPVRDRAGELLIFDGPSPVLVPDTSIMLGVVRSGYGMALLPRLLVEREEALVRLVPLLSEYTSDPSEIYVSFPPRRTQIPAIREFVDLLVEHSARFAQDDFHTL